MPRRPLPRENLRSVIRRALIADLLSGVLKAGDGINEQQLANQLGVSRTPLREALLQLQFEGLVESAPGKGFSVTDPSPKTVRDLYAAVGSLEALCLRLSGIPNGETLQHLAELDHARAKEEDPGKMIKLDTRWHDELLQDCENAPLMEVLQLLKNRLYRYEWDFMSDGSQVSSCLDQHHMIIQALDDENLALARRRLDEHWQLGADREELLDS